MSWAAGLVSSLGSMAGSSGAAGAAGSGATAAGTGTAGATAGAGAAGGGVAGGTAGAAGSGSGMFSNIMAKATPNTYQAMQQGQGNTADVMEFARAVSEDANRYKQPVTPLTAPLMQDNYSAPIGAAPTMQRRQTPVITGFNL